MMMNRSLLFKDIIPIITNRNLFIRLYGNRNFSKFEFGNAELIVGKAKEYENYIVKDIECTGLCEMNVWLGEEYKEDTMTNKTLLFKDIMPVIVNRILFITLHSDDKMIEFGNADIIDGKAKDYENYIVKDIECAGQCSMNVWLGEEW